MIKPYSGYLICGEPRSGTTFLKLAIEGTGVLGRPYEHLRRPIESRQVERGGPAFTEMLSRASTPNGIYGIKLFSYQMDLVRNGTFIDWLPDPRFIYVERRDLLGQAISFARARQTGSYVARNADRREARYDRKLIGAELHKLAIGRARWEEYFAINAINPLRLEYEELVADPARAIATIASLMRIAPPPMPEQSLPVRQADSRSDEWRARFLAEAGNPNRLPDPFLPGRLLARRWIRNIQAILQKSRS